MVVSFAYYTVFIVSVFIFLKIDHLPDTSRKLAKKKNIFDSTMYRITVKLISIKFHPPDESLSSESDVSCFFAKCLSNKMCEGQDDYIIP